MKTKQKQWLLYIVISAILAVSLFLMTLSEIMSYRIAVLFLSGAVLLIPAGIIIGLIKEKEINKKWYIVIIFLLIIFTGILFKTFSLSDKELHDRMEKIEFIDILSS